MWTTKRIERDGEIVSVPIYEDDDENGYDTREEKELDTEIKNEREVTNDKNH